MKQKNSQPDSSTTARPGKKIKPSVLLAILIFLLLAAVVLFYFYRVSYYKGHFLKGSIINGYDYSGYTVDEVETAIDDDIHTYSLELTGRDDMTDLISSDDINYHYVPDGSVLSLLKEQNPYRWFLPIKGKDAQMSVTTSYDTSLLEKRFDELTFFDSSLLVKPTDAYVKYSEKDGYSIVDEVIGNKVKKKKLYDAITNAIENHEPSIDLEKEGLFFNPEYTSESPKIIKYCDKLNRYTGLTITYDFEDRSETLDRPILHDWMITDDDNFTVTINPDKVTEYVNYLGYEYDTFSYTRDFTTHDGQKIKVSGGDYGWLINRGEETEALTKIIKKGKDVTREPIYRQEAHSRSIDDIGDTYIEADLTAQHLWVYKNGKMMVETDFVSGDVSRSRETPTGIFAILYKERDAQLVGETYDTKVSYWMPFYDNCGIHDAGWRGSFGGDIYKTDGSHGCLNSPPAKAQAIFETIDAGTPIIVYKGSKASKGKTDPNGNPF